MQYGGPAVWQQMHNHVERVEPALAAVEQSLPSDFPQRTWRLISRGMREQVIRFQAGLVGLLA